MKHSRVYRRLRFNFVWVSALSIAVVLLIALFFFMMLTAYSNLRSSRNMTAYIASCDGNLFDLDDSAADSSAPPSLFNYSIIGEPDLETKYRTRFLIAYTVDGESFTYNLDNIASVSEEKARELALNVLDSGKEVGLTEEYGFRVVRRDQQTAIVLLDCTEYIRTYIIAARNIFTVESALLLAVILFCIPMSKRAIKPFEAAVLRQNRFFADAGHEIKTPLAVISANSEVLRLENGDSQWLDSIDRQVERSVNLLSDLISLSGFYEDTPALSNCEFDASSAVREVASDFKAAASSLGADFTVDIEQGISLFGSETDFRRLTAILCDNAVKYCSDEKKISLCMYRDSCKGIIFPRFIKRIDKNIGKKKKSLCRVQAELVLEVSNSCSGLTEKHLRYIFDRFWRLDDSRSREGGGHGLGLSIARKLAASQNGRIAAELKNGEKEIAFTVSLPIYSH